MNFNHESLDVCGTAVHSVRHTHTGVAEELSINAVTVLLSKPTSGKRYMVLRYAEDGAFNIREIELDWQTEANRTNLTFVWADKDDCQINRYHALKFQKRPGFDIFVKSYSQIEKGARVEGMGGLELPMEKIVACIGLMDKSETLKLVKVVLCLVMAQVWRWMVDQAAWLLQ